MQLINPLSENRPENAAEVAERLSSLAELARRVPPTRSVSSRFSGQNFVGRQAELELLHEALAVVWGTSDAPAIMAVSGSAGMGKSALIDKFRRQAEGMYWGHFVDLHAPTAAADATVAGNGGVGSDGLSGRGGEGSATAEETGVFGAEGGDAGPATVRGDAGPALERGVADLRGGVGERRGGADDWRGIWDEKRGALLDRLRTALEGTLPGPIKAEPVLRWALPKGTTARRPSEPGRVSTSRLVAEVCRRFNQIPCLVLGVPSPRMLRHASFQALVDGLREVRGFPLALILEVRDETDGEQTAAALEEIGKSLRIAGHVHLEGLDEPEILEFARHLDLPHRLTETRARELLWLTLGNPFALEHMLQMAPEHMLQMSPRGKTVATAPEPHARETGSGVDVAPVGEPASEGGGKAAPEPSEDDGLFDDGRTGRALPQPLEFLPQILRDRIQARLDRLSTGAATILRRLVALDSPFDEHLASAVRGPVKADAAELIQQLRDQGLLRRVPLELNLDESMEPLPGGEYPLTRFDRPLGGKGWLIVDPITEHHIRHQGSIHEGLQIEVHTLAAEALSGRDENKWSFEEGWHWQAAGCIERAAIAYRYSLELVSDAIPRQRAIWSHVEKLNEPRSGIGSADYLEAVVKHGHLRWYEGIDGTSSARVNRAVAICQTRGATSLARVALVAWRVWQHENVDQSLALLNKVTECLSQADTEHLRLRAKAMAAIGYLTKWQPTEVPSWT